jgi:hypothetical protein
MGGLVKAIFGGNDAPPPPDYAAAARETAAGNKEAAQFAVNANRINQVTPYGSLTYSRAQPAFDQAGYDKAMAAYNAGTPSNQYQVPYYTDDGELSFRNAVQPGTSGTAPTREQFTAADDGGGWTQTMNLTPQAQATLDKQMKLSDQYADTASKGFANVQGLLENPNIDTSGMPEFRSIDTSQLKNIRELNQAGLPDIRNLNTSNLNQIRQLGLDGLPQAPISAGQTAQDAIFSRLNPTLSRDDEALRTRLANQGIQLGSSAYNREMDLQGQRANDLRLQAAAQGISLDQAARQQAFGERKDLSTFDMAQRAQGFGENQAMSNFDLTNNQRDFGQRQAMTAADLQTNQLQFNQQAALAAQQNQQRQAMMQEALAKQSRPLDLVNALRTGAQVNNPQFNSFAQQANVAGPDLLSATNQQYGQQISAYNADQAAGAGLMSGLGSLAMAGAKAGMFSDRRMKENIIKIGELNNGLNLYKFDYKPEFKNIAGFGTYVGVMADEAQAIPDAVIRQSNGYDMVDYSKVY